MGRTEVPKSEPSLKKLPHNFKPMLTEVSKSVNISGKLSYEDTIQRFYQINRILDKNECEPYDMDNVIRHYGLKTELAPVVRDLKKFTYRKNHLIFEKARRSKHWKGAVKDLKRFAQEAFEGKIHTQDVEKAFIQVLKPYAKHWLGFWSVISLHSDGRIKQIGLFDIHDKDQFLWQMSQQIQNKFKLEATQKRIQQVGGK